MTALRFKNFGGTHQFVVSDEDDLARIDSVDPARWAATSAPRADLHCDEAFLRYLDPESTGRVHVSQIVAARDWLFARLSRRGVVRERAAAVALDALDAKSDAGSAVRAAAERVNRERGAAEAKEIALADVRAYQEGYRKLLANGDGVIPPEVVPEEDVKAFLADVIDVTGGTPDRGGATGVDGAGLERFMTRAKLWAEWRAAGAAARPWGDETDAAAALVRELDPKLEAFFLHCELLRQESPSPESLRLKDDDLRALRLKAADDIAAYLRGSPLATPVAEGVLSLTGAVNALYHDRFEALRAAVLRRALGDGATSLTRARWREVRAIFDGLAAWEALKLSEPFEKLGDDKVRSYLEGGLRAKVEAYIALDLAAAKEIEAVDALEKLLLYVRWLVELANNFVNFSAIYLPTVTALVEAGSLVIDGRRLDFCLRVTDRAAHKAVATLSNIYLVYVEVLEKEGGAVVYQLMAPLTGGEAGRLRVGKRGLFIDLAGKELDAIVTEIVDNPFSVRQAAFAPFRRAARMISSKIEQYVASAQASQESAMTARAEAGVTAAQGTVEAGAVAARGVPPTPPPSEPTRPAAEPLNVNSLILGGGMLLGGLSVVLGALFGALKEPGFWLAIAGVVVAVMAVSALLGWLKLQRRDLALLLEANGWAVNIRMTITRRVARVFAFVPVLPEGSVLERIEALPGGPDDEENTVRTVAGVIVLTAVVAGAWLFRRRLGLTH